MRRFYPTESLGTDLEPGLLNFAAESEPTGHDTQRVRLREVLRQVSEHEHTLAPANAPVAPQLRPEL